MLSKVTRPLTGSGVHQKSDLRRPTHGRATDTIMENGLLANPLTKAGHSCAELPTTVGICMIALIASCSGQFVRYFRQILINGNCVSPVQN